jgi:hypothetical protein
MDDRRLALRECTEPGLQADSPLHTSLTRDDMFTGPPGSVLGRSEVLAVPPERPPYRTSVRRTLAQIAIGSGFARLLQHDLPGAAREVAPVLALPPERRLATMAGKLTELAVACETAAMSGAGAQAAELAGHIRDYCQQTAASALPGKESP